MASLLNMSGGSLLNKGSLLPSGYTQLEYIENTSNAYIDTGVKVKSPIEFEGNIEFTTKTNNCGWGLFYYGNPKIYFFLVDVNFRFAGGYNGYLEPNIKLLKPTIGIKYKIKSVAKSGEQKYYVNDELVASYSKTDEISVNYNFLLFTLVTTRYFTLCKSFGCLIKQDGTLIRNFIPCINPNNVVGMYDTVKGNFYSSPNGVAFIAGPEV